MRQMAIAIRSKGATLEGVIGQPAERAGRTPAAVVCHGHPMFGNTMESGLVVAICRALTERGFACLRFNFRGVGGSEGQFTNGEREHEDVMSALKAAAAWPQMDRKRLSVVGYSFGALAVLTGLKRLKDAGAIALLSPPLAASRHLAGHESRRPLLVTVGEQDRIVAWNELQESVRALRGAPRFEVLPGADHSYQGHESEVARRVAAFLSEVS